MSGRQETKPRGVGVQGQNENQACSILQISDQSDPGLGGCSPLCDDYPAGDNGFTGRIEWVRIDRAEDGHDHLLDPEHVLHFAMSRQ
jgi:hypothetical protein